MGASPEAGAMQVSLARLQKICLGHSAGQAGQWQKCSLRSPCGINPVGALGLGWGAGRAPLAVVWVLCASLLWRCVTRTPRG